MFFDGDQHRHRRRSARQGHRLRNAGATFTWRIRTAFDPSTSDRRAGRQIVSRTNPSATLLPAKRPLTTSPSNVGKQSIPALHDGKARLIVTAVSNDLRRKTDSKSMDVDVMTAPPRVVADGVQHYINQGGSEMATFTPSGAWTEAGVKVGDYTFRSFPAARIIPASTSACSRSPGNCRSTRRSRSMRAIPRAQWRRQLSGTKCSRRSSAPARFRSNP